MNNADFASIARKLLVATVIANASVIGFWPGAAQAQICEPLAAKAGDAMPSSCEPPEPWPPSPPPPTSPGNLSGAFIYLGYGATSESLTLSQIPAFFDEMQDLNHDTLITTQTRVKRNGQGCAYTPTGFEWVKGLPSKLGTILNAAQARGMRVYVGTTMTSHECPTFWGLDNTRSIVDDIHANLAVVARQYGSHPAFAGWYIPDEAGTLGSEKYDYYRRITAALKALTPGKPVAIAPYNFNQQPPNRIGQVAVQFRNATGVDIQIWQDSIGAAPEAKLFHWSRPGHTSEQYYQALASALGPNGLWADVELFNYGRPLFNSTPNGLTGGYRSTSASRLNQQLWSARSAGKRVSWLHQWHTSEVIGPANAYVEAPQLQAAYRAMYGIGGARFLTPPNHANYTWISSPSANYPDGTGYELFDRRTGDPRNPTDPAWVGIDGVVGTARVRIDLGSLKTVDWLGVHALTYPAWGIRGPTTLDLYCGSTASALTRIATVNAPFTQANLSSVTEEEYVLGNRAPLRKSCRFVELRIPTNGNWVFISEIELTSD